ncbi:MAG: PAS domain S-box protein [Candidatus Omnitrophica bacterium]|nr:PAS domain S-box protein [Candidatus Omnitrophota bacterium]
MDLVNASREIEDLYHSAPCGYHSLDGDGTFVRINDTELAWLGYARHEVVGKLKWTDVIIPEEAPMFQTIFPIFKKQGWVRDLEYTLVRKDGTLLPVLLSATAITDADGRFLMSRSVVYDLTSRRHAEEERNRIFNLSLDLLCVEGFDGYFKQLNPQWERVLGFSTQELCSRPYVEFVHPNDRASTEAEAQKLLAGQVLATFENRYLCKDGSYKWFLWNAVPLPEHRLIYAAARDITERKRVEHELQRAHLELQKSHEELKAAHLQLIQTAKLESVGRLAAGVAHEVKNPLAIILQGVDYLSKRLNGREEDTRTVLRYTADAVRRADAVIKGLLDFSTTRELTLTAEHLNTVLEQAFLLVKHELDVAHIMAVKMFQEPLPLLRIDRNKIEQVFVNLFMNAIQAMPRGGTLTVKTHVERLKEVGEDIGWRVGDQLRIGDSVIVTDVEDTGAGISDEVLERAFDPFFTTKPTGQGTGLGLTVSKKIIELHGGMIRIRNRARGLGVKVTVALKVEGGDTNGHETHSAD